MAHSRTAKKNIRQNIKARAHNRAASSRMRTEIKKLRTAVAAGDKAAAAAALPIAHKLLDKAAKRNRIHNNRAARVKGQLSRAVHSM